MNSPIKPHSHSQLRPYKCYISGSKTVGGGKVARGIIKNPQRNTLNPDPWARLIWRANEEQILVNGQPVTTLQDTGSQVTHISHDYFQAKGIPITPNQSTSPYRRNRGDTIEYLGFIEAKLSFPMGPHMFETEAFLLVLPTTEYQRRVPVTINT